MEEEGQAAYLPYIVNALNLGRTLLSHDSHYFPEQL